LTVWARYLEAPVVGLVLSELRLGALADDVIGELEREQAERAVHEREREQARRRLRRDVEAMEENLTRLFASDVLTPERVGAVERQIAAKRAELAALDEQPEAGGRRM